MRLCKFCGKEFIPHHPRTLYCSRICRGKFYREKYKIRIRAYKKIHDKAYFLSNREKIREYRKQYYWNHREESIRKAKEWSDLHPEVNKQATRRYKDNTRFSGMRDFILERDNRTCQLCGKPSVLIHHKDENSYHNSDNPNNAPENLIILCRPCHTHLHKSQGGRRQVSTPSLK